MKLLGTSLNDRSERGLRVGFVRRKRCGGADAAAGDGGPIDCPADQFNLDDETCATCDAFGDPDAVCGNGVCDRRGGACIAASSIVFVAPTGSDAVNCGASSAPCASIAMALTVADAVRSIVVLVPGAHQLSAVVDIDATNAERLIGYGATVGLEPSATGTMLRVTGGSFSVEGVTLRETPAPLIARAALALANSGNMPSVRDVTIEGFLAVAIEAQQGPSARRLLVESTTLRNNGTGIQSTDAIPRVFGSFFDNNTTGISFSKSEDLEFHLNSFRGHAVAINCDGESEMTTVSGNIILDGSVQSCLNEEFIFEASYALDLPRTLGNLAAPPELDCSLVLAGSTALDNTVFGSDRHQRPRARQSACVWIIVRHRRPRVSRAWNQRHQLSLDRRNRRCARGRSRVPRLES